MPKPERTPFDLGEWLQSIVALYSGTSEVDLVVDQADFQLVGDRDQLTQVMVNLLNNARDAIEGRPSGRIGVKAEVAHKSVQLTVEDNGPGFDEQTAAQLFTPYFTTKGPHGTGLGLAICHRIISDHGGTIRVFSTPGTGARFAIDLPHC